MQKWTQEEVNFLIQNKGNLSHSQMADHLGKSLIAVNRKIQKLGITKKQTGSRLSSRGKKCSKCLLFKSGEEFANNKTRIDGKESWCKSCRSFSVRENKYGMTEEEYKARFTAQNGVCKICGVGCDNLCVDHCHATGKVRELLCSSCNLLLGNAQDNPNILASAILYLKAHGKKIQTIDTKGRLSSGFLVSRKKCCDNGCQNCPY